MQLRIELVSNQLTYRPFDTVRGVAHWSLEAMARLEARLFWYTEGKGSQDVGIVATQPIHATSLAGQQPFEFNLPESPYSYHGKLISIQWALELLQVGKKEAEIVRLVVSPWSKPVEAGDAAPSLLPPK